MSLPSSSLLLPGPAWPGVRVGVTTRAGGASAPPFDTFNLGDHVGDDPAAVAHNRARLRQAMPDDPCWLRQVHGTHVHDADAVHDGLPEADAAVTTRVGRLLAILTADCLPVVLTDTQGRVLGVAHAGWRGLAGGVLEATLAALKARAPDARWQAWIGPAIGPSAFEVGADVLSAFPDATRFFVPRDGHPGKWWCDLPGLATARLAAAGVEDVVCSDLCTVADARFYSYRRDGQTGRIATVAWLETPRE
ncbi:peptidoglycan editing factor PgeF [Achromobacter sp. GG226]|uniref:peptidoglycan editing factor PgeF n=1 Tax=Verticiella alkaliphila TaxID=2779529 RepID=UPI001C0E84CA|nr:peptidoglycan editing factor PgeF [Verticiella sp. GG226]MBU4612812.1 peptidoglycan editing factor PgeF [Verticiella sp. GG226]